MAKGITYDLKHAEQREMIMGGQSSAVMFNVVAVLGRREAKDTKRGDLFLRWHLTGVRPRCPPHLTLQMISPEDSSLTERRPG